MSNDELYSARCKACDRPFHPRWRPEHESFEELCHVCLPLALGRQKENDIDDDLLDLLGITTNIMDQYNG